MGLFWFRQCMSMGYVLCVFVNQMYVVVVHVFDECNVQVLGVS